MKGNDLVFQYFLGDESEQFSFIRVPKMFFTDKRFGSLSYGAKILYGLLLDRLGLSRKNGWYDGQHRAYVIYTIESIREDFSVSKTVAIKIMKELEEFGLIEKKRRPNAAAIIYVKNFILPEETKGEEMPDNSGSPYGEPPEVRNMEVQNIDFQKCAEISGSPESGLPEYELPEVQKMESNKTNKNKTNNISSSSDKDVDMRKKIEEKIQEKIHYREILEAGYERKMVDAMIDSLVEPLCLKAARQGQVKKIWDNLTERNFIMVLENMRKEGADTIYNLSSYIAACFCNIVNLNKADCRQKERGFHFSMQHSYDFDELEKKLLETDAQKGG